jgi:hypothetical protein
MVKCSWCRSTRSGQCVRVVLACTTVLDAKVPYGLDPMHFAIMVEIEVRCLALTILAV